MNHPARRKARAAGRTIQLARKRNAEGQGRVTRIGDVEFDRRAAKRHLNVAYIELVRGTSTDVAARTGGDQIANTNIKATLNEVVATDCATVRSVADWMSTPSALAAIRPDTARLAGMVRVKAFDEAIGLR